LGGGKGGKDGGKEGEKGKGIRSTKRQARQPIGNLKKKLPGPYGEALKRTKVHKSMSKKERNLKHKIWTRR